MNYFVFLYYCIKNIMLPYSHIESGIINNKTNKGKKSVWTTFSF